MTDDWVIDSTTRAQDVCVLCHTERNDKGGANYWYNQKRAKINGKRKESNALARATSRNLYAQRWLPVRRICKLHRCNAVATLLDCSLVCFRADGQKDRFIFRRSPGSQLSFD